MMSDLIYKDGAFEITGKCMEVHNNPGAGFLEIVYKDALEYEFLKADIPLEIVWSELQRHHFTS